MGKLLDIGKLVGGACPQVARNPTRTATRFTIRETEGFLEHVEGQPAATRATKMPDGSACVNVPVSASCDGDRQLRVAVHE